MSTICRNNLIKLCQRDHLLDGILKGLRVRAAGLQLFIVSIDDLVCQLCIGCSLSLSNNRTKLCVITVIFSPSYFLTGTSSKKSLGVIDNKTVGAVDAACQWMQWVASAALSYFCEISPLITGVCGDHQESLCRWRVVLTLC